MTTNRSNLLIAIVALVAYLVMIAVNAMANILPINNLSTGAVSDAYPNLFAPAAITFSIWGVIYLMLGAYCIYQLSSKKVNAKVAQPVNLLFIATSVFNSAWIFSWHYRLIGLSVILMLALLVSLIKIADLLHAAKLNKTEKLICKIPFGTYFGWITVATIANITVFLVSIGWNGFGLTDTFWMSLVLLVGVGIASWRMHKDHNLTYGLVPVWAYFGIMYKQISPEGFNGEYPTVIATVAVSLLLLIASNGYLLLKKKAI